MRALASAPLALSSSAAWRSRGALQRARAPRGGRFTTQKSDLPRRDLPQQLRELRAAAGARAGAARGADASGDDDEGREGAPLPLRDSPPGETSSPQTELALGGPALQEAAASGKAPGPRRRRQPPPTALQPEDEEALRREWEKYQLAQVAFAPRALLKPPCLLLPFDKKAREPEGSGGRLWHSFAAACGCLLSLSWQTRRTLERKSKLNQRRPSKFSYVQYEEAAIACMEAKENVVRAAAHLKLLEEGAAAARPPTRHSPCRSVSPRHRQTRSPLRRAQASGCCACGWRSPFSRGTRGGPWKSQRKTCGFPPAPSFPLLPDRRWALGKPQRQPPHRCALRLPAAMGRRSPQTPTKSTPRSSRGAPRRSTAPSGRSRRARPPLRARTHARNTVLPAAPSTRATLSAVRPQVRLTDLELLQLEQIHMRCVIRVLHTKANDCQHFHFLAARARGV